MYKSVSFDRRPPVENAPSRFNETVFIILRIIQKHKNTNGNSRYTLYACLVFQYIKDFSCILLNRHRHRNVISRIVAFTIFQTITYGPKCVSCQSDERSESNTARSLDIDIFNPEWSEKAMSGLCCFFCSLGKSTCGRTNSEIVTHPFEIIWYNGTLERSVFEFDSNSKNTQRNKR